MLCPSACIVDRADLVKQMKTEQFKFEESRLLKENVMGFLQLIEYFEQSDTELTKVDTLLTQYRLLTHGEKISMKAYNSDCSSSLISASSGQLLYAKHSFFLINDWPNSRKLSEGLDAVKAIWCGVYIASINS